MGQTEFILTLVLYILPLYIANSIPILIHGKTPLDFGRKIAGKPIFGKGKTITGTVAGILVGTIAGLAVATVFPYSAKIIPNYIELAFFLSLGAILGDLVKSFFKRRFGIKSGEKWEMADQLDFIIGGLVLSTIFVQPADILLAAVLIVLTFFVHKISNYLAYRLKLKKVPW